MKVIKKGNPEFVEVNGVTYEALPLEFMDKGRRFVQLERVGDIALYEVYDEFNIPVVWEMIRIKTTNENTSTIGGVKVTFKAKENYPSDEGFGTLGKCFGNKQNAIEYWEIAKKAVAV